MNDLKSKQIRREKDSQDAGYKKFMKNEKSNAKNNNGSATSFGLMVKKHLLNKIVKDLENKISRDVGYNKKKIAAVIQRLLAADASGSTSDLFDIETAAFIGLQLALATALNPNQVEDKEASRAGGDKKLLVKKTVPQLQVKIGDVIHKQIQLKIIQKAFPDWFRFQNQRCRQPFKDGARASTAYWEDNLFRAIRGYANELREQGRLAEAELIEDRKVWSYSDCTTIGSLVLSSVINVCNHYITLQHGSRMGKRSLEIVLTEAGKLAQKEIQSFAASYQHDLLPMLVEPLPITNENLGGWFMDSLQEPELGHNGSIWLSDKHLEFINRQARTRFQINPFTQAVMEELCERQWQLGKFHYQEMEELICINRFLGYDHLEGEEQDKAVHADPRTKGLRRTNTAIHARNNKRVRESLIAYAVKDKAQKCLEDEAFYIPMKPDFRGRIYSRVPFISFQSNDAGRYLIRFADATPIDDRTEHWLKIGISNAAGNDKLCWDKRLKWFDKNRDAIINVGRMVDGGDFRSAYEFLTKDNVEDPFCLAALANEYVKVFVDETQDYTQCYVCVDASCSGTSIFNAWRQNLNGALKTNLVDTPAPADIYMEVWNEIKRIAPEGTFDAKKIKRLEDTKLIRKCMKSVYVPAQYASPKSEQHKNLKEFNKKLKKLKLEFNDKELANLQELWDEALDNVSSIQTVVSWFQARTREALKLDDTIRFTTCNGSLMTLKYPKTKLKRIQTYGYGSADYKQEWVEENTDKVDTRRMLNAVTANVTHATDAAALCEALWNWEQSPFVAIHDACGVPPGKHLEDALIRLKDGLVTATSFDVWKGFRDDNGLEKTSLNAGPVIGDLKDWDLVRRSNYLYS